MIPVVDLSEFQGAIDPAPLVAAGIRHAIVRCADPARRPPPDPFYVENSKALRDAGITTDTYVFVRATDESPADAADRYTGWAEAIESPGRLWLDGEWGTEGLMWPEELADWLLGLMDGLDRLGWRGNDGWYTNANWWNGYVAPAADDAAAALPLWVSGYPFGRREPPAPGAWESWLATVRPQLPRPWIGTTWTGWQFSSANTLLVPGHDLDCSVFVDSYLKSKPTTEERTVPQIWTPSWATERSPGRITNYELLADGHHVIAWNGAELRDPDHPDQPHPGMLSGPDGFVLNLEDFYGPGPYSGIDGFDHEQVALVTNGAAGFKIPTGFVYEAPAPATPVLDLPGITSFVLTALKARLP